MTDALIDTQALLWWLTDDQRLGVAARHIMATRPLSVSVGSLWEIAIKAQIGKLDADVTEVARAVDAQGMKRLMISDTHLAAYQALPRRSDHGDPFDRLLVSQAQVEGIPILTSDSKLAPYGVSTIDALQ
ncbi:type II toxin-antitoxin system VapC family toxin [Rubrimonas sp.]|uniref:type II toxin-antitoxin system VapC family toxin n=1 Tax=Rubrimonas sp. TaxID=2036015 RepID=UPI002FDD6A66